MRRWNFISGLTVILLLLLVLCGFCVWTARTLSGEINQMISGNFDTLRALRGIRLAVSRIDAQYRSSTSTGEIPRALGLYELARTDVEQHLRLVRRTSSEEPEEVKVVARLEALVRDYFTYYDEYLALGRFEGDRFKALTRNLAQSAAEITEATAVLSDMNERDVLQRRSQATAKGQRVVYAALGIALFSIGIYVWTSIRLTRAIFDPLRQLRDSIVKVSQRQFDVAVPVKSGDELAQIATTFNTMASELRAYVAETDQRVVEANRVSRAILEALPYPIYIVDDSFAVRLMNPRAEQLSAALEIPGAVPGAVRRAIDDAAAIGGELIGDDLHRAVEVALPAATGTPATFLPQVFRMAGAAGVNEGWAVLLIDVTKLRQFDLAKSKALSIIGHEVKTPVTSIRMTLHLLLEEKIGALTADQRELVQAGRDDCERLLTVLQALLELARFESGRVTMRLVPVPPGDLLAQADAMHGDYLRRLGVAIVMEPTAPTLPAVQADAIHVVRVLGNFLTNAAKYGAPDQPVTLRAELRADAFVRLSVRNRTPRPLTEAEQTKVFEPFYRREGEGSEGTGLGLTICREIAAAHSGRVGVWASGDWVDFYLDLRIVSVSQNHAAGQPTS
ncbi:MAG: HAMP domain-containing protein [Opitutaceae bacterium]|nr:HAMP domain-containing protein [Opitutaceae bacterium]